MRILVDTNILLDYLAKREPFLKSAEAIFDACAMGVVDGAIAAHSFSNMFYILRNVFSVAERKTLLLDLCSLFAVEGIDRQAIESALENKRFDDFEDGLQVECAKSFDANYIVTRDPSGYAGSSVPIISPDEFMQMFPGKHDE
jgi:predicted nucleic acid-binding protein